MATPTKTAPKSSSQKSSPQKTDVKGAAVDVKQAEKNNLPVPPQRAQTNQQAAATLPPTQSSVISPEAAKAEADLQAKSIEENQRRPEVVQNEANLELLGNLVRGSGMGTDQAAREQLVRSNHATPAEMPKVETVVDKDVQKVVDAQDKAAEDATKEQEKATAEAQKQQEKASADAQKQADNAGNK